MSLAVRRSRPMAPQRILSVLAVVLCAMPARARTVRVTLQEAEQILYERNQTIVSARASIRVAEAELAIAGQYPNLGFAFNHDHIPFGSQNAYSGSSAQPLPSSNRFLLDNAASAVLSWTIEIGKRGPRQEGARMGIVAARQSAFDVVRKKIAEVRAAFIEGLRAGEELKMARDVLASQQETLRVNEARLRAGAIPEADVIK